MDSSISQALIIASSILLSIIVISFMTYSFGKIGSWATEREQEVLIEQREQFNKEYEVYDKDLMYGVDVISCLNKAKSNNDKIEDKRLINGDNYDNSYKVTVKFTINSELNESIRVYYMDQSSKKEREYQVEQPTKDLKRLNEIFNVSQKYSGSGISVIKFDKTLQKYSEKTSIKGDYSLGLTSETPQEIIALLSISNEVRQTVQNKSSTSSSKGSWTKAVWETPLYDLKTRKFKCTNLTYNVATGRVDYIEFKEL